MASFLKCSRSSFLRPLSLKARLFNNTQFLICRVMYHFTNAYTNCSLSNYALELKRKSNLKRARFLPQIN
uniref:Uncharacterized protein n=1 Tax=Trichogramma kaykai TaxID=54128 RepID=A0ABD2VV86_9HYME